MHPNINTFHALTRGTVWMHHSQRKHTILSLWLHLFKIISTSITIWSDLNDEVCRISLSANLVRSLKPKPRPLTTNTLKGQHPTWQASNLAHRKADEQGLLPHSIPTDPTPTHHPLTFPPPPPLGHSSPQWLDSAGMHYSDSLLIQTPFKTPTPLTFLSTTNTPLSSVFPLSHHLVSTSSFSWQPPWTTWPIRLYRSHLKNEKLRWDTRWTTNSHTIQSQPSHKQL